MKSKIVLLIALFLCAACSDAVKGRLEGSVREYTLPNGMKWLLVKKGYAPVFAGIVQIKAGSADEERGKTGLAHFLEHMSFKGTSTIGTKDNGAEKAIMDKLDALAEEGSDYAALEALTNEQREYIVPNEVWDIFTRNGVNNLNAFTSKDVTTYHVEMPVAKLELWLFLTSEMLSDPVLREFYPERNVVLEELRTSIDNSPEGKLYTELLATAFDKSPYSWPTIGIKDDVARLRTADMKDFYGRKYVPECMTGAIVGDIDIPEASRLIDEYFGKLKRRDASCNRTLALDPPQRGEKGKEITFDASPMLVMAFRKPTVPNFADYVFDIYSYILCDGESSRMQKDLVKEKKIAKTIECFNSYPGTRLENLFTVYAEPFDAASLDDLKKEIMSELNRLATEKIAPDELEKIKNQIKMSFYSNIDSNFELAQTLVYFENIAGSWRYILNHAANVDQITADDILATARKYFAPDNMTVLTLKR